MSTVTSIPAIENSSGEGADRVGVIASVLCAIHCAATPVILLFAPAFGELWAHPASHWIVALFVVPLAFVMVLRGFRIHRQRWIVATGLAGMVLIIVGAILPYLSETNEAAVGEAAVASESDEATGAESEADFVWVVGEDLPAEETELHAEGCPDSCCPSLLSDGEGNTILNIPAASIVTTLGGIALICTHLGNLCACRKREKTGHCDAPFC